MIIAIHNSTTNDSIFILTTPVIAATIMGVFFMILILALLFKAVNVKHVFLLSAACLHIS